jgi:invasion protein IalB
MAGNVRCVSSTAFAKVSSKIEANGGKTGADVTLRRFICHAALSGVLLGAAPAESQATRPEPLAGRMTLGVELPTLSPGRAPPARRGARKDCQAWERTAARLGETFAGWQLRRSIVDRACALESRDTREPVWVWPWLDDGLEGGLPSRVAGTHGAWVARCSGVGRRERCALVHEGRLQTVDGASVRFATHFVVDRIGGVERLVWRVYVYFPDVAVNLVELRPSTGSIEIAADGGATVEHFDACGRAGCLMEAEVKASADIAARLREGRRIHLDLALPGTATRYSGDIGIDGAGLGLRLLARLKRLEASALNERSDTAEDGAVGLGRD